MIIITIKIDLYHNKNMSADSTASAESKPREMTVDEYSDLVAKWQEAYYAWNASSMNYYK